MKSSEVVKVSSEVEGESNMREVVIENEDADEVDVVDCDLRDDTVDQQVQEETKVGLQRGRKPKALDGNPGKRPSQRKY
ncbi:hypothetical protein YC2023_041510 [Brassica napus]